MNPKQERFCTEFVVDLNGKKAASRAGYSKASAHVTASRLLADAKVQQKIAELQVSLAQRTGITVERVLREYQKYAFSDIRDSVTIRALDSIAKHLGMFLDKEQSPDKGLTKFSGTLTELLAMYRQMTAKSA